MYHTDGRRTPGSPSTMLERCSSCGKPRMAAGRCPVAGPNVQKSPAENLTKEVEEESGYRTRAVKLLAVYDSGRSHTCRPFPTTTADCSSFARSSGVSRGEASTRATSASSASTLCPSSRSPTYCRPGSRGYWSTDEISTGRRISIGPGSDRYSTERPKATR